MNARTLIFAVCTSAPLACSDPELEPVTFANVCGEAGPIRALELAEDHDLDSTQRIGERLYHHIGRIERIDGTPLVNFTERSTWSTGLCGESPVHIADDISNLYTTERWPGVLLGCTPKLGLVSLDPEGVAPPHPLFSSAACSFEWTDHGIVALAPGDGLGALLLHPYPDDPRRETTEAIVLIPQVLPDTLTIRPDAVHAITPAHELVRVDLASLAVTSVQPQVRSYSLSADERYLLWQDTVATGGSPMWPDGVVSLRDDRTGSSVALGVGSHLDEHNLQWAARGLVLFSDPHQKIYFLPTLNFIALPPNHHLDHEGPLEDGRWLAENLLIGSGPWLTTVDLADGATSPLFSRRAQLLARYADSILVLDVAECCTGEGPLWRVPFDRSPPRRLAERATREARLADPHRVVTPLDIDAAQLGTLVLVDADTHSEQRIDDSVDAGSFTVLPAPDSLLVAYAVHDGDRSGVWLAHLPLAP